MTIKKERFKKFVDETIKRYDGILTIALKEEFHPDMVDEMIDLLNDAKGYARGIKDAIDTE